MRRNPALVIALAASVAASSACRSARTNEDAGTLPAPEADANAAVPVIVENQSTNQVDVYAVRAGERVRVGDVPSLGTATLKVPRSAFDSDGTLRLLGRPVAGPGLISTGALTVQPGQTVKWRIAPDPAMSTATVE
jgi:hypothetical protein